MGQGSPGELPEEEKREVKGREVKGSREQESKAFKSHRHFFSCKILSP